MNKNLLVKSILSAAVLTAISACSDVEEGFDPNFESSNPVVLTGDSIDVSYDEESGIKTINLLQNATIDGQPATDFEGSLFINQPEIVALNGFNTPQAPANSIANQTISPFSFSEDGTQLLIDTDKFAEALRECDNTDATGARDADGNQIGDGIIDYPTSATYEISYAIDNGYELAPGEELPRQSMTVTINAIEDVVTGVIASMVELPAGGQAPVIASVTPSYACDASMTYTVADTDIATVDANGQLTGTGTGSTTVTITSSVNPDASATADVNVTAAFSIAITNDDKDELGASTGMKEVPACTSAAVEIEPSVLNHTLNGEYLYDWTSSDEANFALAESAKLGFGATGVFTTTSTVGATADITVALESGDTGATSLNDIASKTVTLTTVKNTACDPGVNSNGDAYVTDFKLDNNSGPAWSGVTTSTVALSGNAIEIPGGANVGAEYGEGFITAHGAWNNFLNYYTQNFGWPVNSVGRKFKFSVWAKLSDPTQGVTVSHVILNWNKPDGVSGPGYDKRLPGAGIQSAELRATTGWQLVELVDKESGTSVWSVPSDWDANSPVFPAFNVVGLPEGQSIILDELAIVEVTE